MSVKKGSFYRSDKTEIIEQQKNKHGAARVFGRKSNPDSFNHKQHQEAYQKFIEWLKSLDNEQLKKVHKSNSLIYKKGRTEWSGAIAQSTFNNSKERFLEGLEEEILARGLLIGGKEVMSAQPQSTFTGNTLQEYLSIMNVNYSGRSGKQARYHCPFHSDRDPSLSVNLEKGLWNCFSCGRQGNTFAFCMELEDLEFKGALARFKELNIYREPTQEEKDAQRDESKAQEEFYDINTRFSTKVRKLGKQYPDYIHKVDQMIYTFDRAFQELAGKVQAGEITIQTAARELQDVYRDRLNWFLDNVNKRGIEPVEVSNEINLDGWGED